MNKIMIVGCGNVGSALSYCFCLKYLDIGFNFDELLLIDPDIIQEHNNFGILGMNKEYINCPKSYILREELKNINNDININYMINDFNAIKNYSYLNNFLKIDCRDSSEYNSFFNIKCCCDGNNGIIVINPKDSIGRSSNYRFWASKYNAFKLSLHTVDLIYNEKYKEESEKKYIINFLGDQIHEF
jgi:tRNA A37 threonylcarbamoyladenosine dehydratase